MTWSERGRRTAGPVLAASLTLMLGWSSEALGNETTDCGDDHRISFSADDGGKTAYWSHKIVVDEGPVWAYCSYVQGIDVPLKEINDWWIDVSGKNVRIFHGFGNHCSAGEFLLYNQHSKAVLIVHSDFSTERHQCK